MAEPAAYPITHDDTFGDNSIWMLQLMYEFDDTGGTTREKAIAWARHTAAFCRSLDPDRLLVYSGQDDDAEASSFTAAGVFDVYSSEGATVGPTFAADLYATLQPLAAPIMYVGYDPLDVNGVRIDNQDDIPDDYSTIGWDHNLEVIRGFVVWGIGPSAFFHYRTYDTAGLLDAYAVTLADFLDTVATWDDEPGVELNRATVPPF